MVLFFLESKDLECGEYRELGTIGFSVTKKKGEGKGKEDVVNQDVVNLALEGSFARAAELGCGDSLCESLSMRYEREEKLSWMILIKLANKPPLI